jgi:hypothetical protein
MFRRCTPHRLRLAAIRRGWAGCTTAAAAAASTRAAAAAASTLSPASHQTRRIYSQRRRGFSTLQWVSVFSKLGSMRVAVSGPWCLKVLIVHFRRKANETSSKNCFKRAWLQIRIRIILGSWIRIRIRVNSWIRIHIRIEVKIQEL